MKQVLFTLLSLCLAGILTAQQTTPLYLLYNSSCMDQLEYRYVYAGTSVVSYSIQPTTNEQYILTTGSSGINSPTLPPNTVNCREYALNEQFLNDVNNVTRQVYIVHQQQRGYLLVPVISATQIIRSGTYYLFRAPSYAFAVDTANLVYESNIATGSSNWYIYFNGLKIRGCYYEYSFKREPTRVSQERSEFDFIPGIGLTTERTGMTPVEAENNQMRLVKVNNMALEDYINFKCQGKTASSTTPPLSKYTPQVGYGPTDVRERDKETASMPPQYGQQTTANAAANLPPLVSCPDLPGEGYHIVQPDETLNSIARAYDVPVRSLVLWNKIKDPDVIQVCQKIWLRKPPSGTQDIVYKGEAAAKTASGPVARRQDGYWNTNIGYDPAPYSTGQDLRYPQPEPPKVHTVEKGETLYGIAQKYGLTEAALRRFNNFPAAGAIVLFPGQQLYLVDCCPDRTGAPGLPTNYNQPPAPITTGVPPNPSYSAPQVTRPTNTTQPAALGHPYYQPQQPAPQQPNNGVLPELFNTPPTTQPGAPLQYGQPTTTTPTAAGGAPQTTPPPPKPTYFQEYIVRQGDTINSVAIKFNVNAQELALVNNKEPNETLIAGQRLLIPRN